MRDRAGLHYIIDAPVKGLWGFSARSAVLDDISSGMSEVDWDSFVSCLKLVPVATTGMPVRLCAQFPSTVAS